MRPGDYSIALGGEEGVCFRCGNPFLQGEVLYTTHEGETYHVSDLVNPRYRPKTYTGRL